MFNNNIKKLLLKWCEENVVSGSFFNQKFKRYGEKI
jgi:hypothetical protein